MASNVGHEGGRDTQEREVKEKKENGKERETKMVDKFSCATREFSFHGKNEKP